MAEYKKYGYLQNSWVMRHLHGSYCRGCKRPMEAFQTGYVACISRRSETYHAYCETCFDEWRAKSLGDAPEGTGSGKEAYDTSAIVKACRMLRMKLLVEGGVLADAIREKEKDRSTHGMTPAEAMAMLIWSFPFSMSKLATNDFRGRGRKDYAYYEKHRMELFVRFARLLRPFLNRITGRMVERIYKLNREELKKKSEERAERGNWRKTEAERPVRLFPITSDSDKLAGVLEKLLPAGMCRVVRKVPGDTWQTKDERCDRAREGLGITMGTRVFSVEARVVIYNTPKGPRVLVHAD